MLEEVLTIREAIASTTQKQMDQVVIESDSLVAEKAINREINPPRFIGNIVDDIKILTKTLRNIKFINCSRLANLLVNMLVKQVNLIVFKC